MNATVKFFADVVEILSGHIVANLLLKALSLAGVFMAKYAERIRRRRGGENALFSQWLELAIVFFCIVFLLSPWPFLKSGVYDRVFVCGCLSGLLAFVALGFIGYDFLRKLLRWRRTDLEAKKKADPDRDPRPTSLLDSCKSVIGAAYVDKQYENFGALQAGFRAALVIFVLGTTLPTLLVAILSDPAKAGLVRYLDGVFPKLFSRVQHDDTGIEPLITNVSVFQVVVACIFFIFMALYYRGQRRRFKVLRKAFTEDPRTEMDSAFRHSVGYDLCFVSLIWATTLMPDRPFQLAYILPMMGVWFFEWHRSKPVFISVLIGLSLHYLIRFLLFLAEPNLGGWLAPLAFAGDSIGFIRPYTLWEFLANIGFWVVLGIIFVFLRHMHGEAKANFAKTENVRLALEILGTVQEQAVFVKGMDRKFLFANHVLLRRFAPFVNGQIEADPLGNRAKWEAIEGKTDEEIGLHFHDEYEKSDKATMKDGHFAKYEPDFSPTATSGEVIWTRKALVKVKKNGVETPIGLVGSVVDGLPQEIQEMSEYLTSHLPIYAAIKDTTGHLRWANERHLEKLKEKIDELFVEKTDFLVRRQLEGVKSYLKCAVFAKNTRRQYVFANEEMIKLLNDGVFRPRPSSAKAKRGAPASDSPAAALAWKDIEGKTDEEIGIPALKCAKYKEDDERILSGKAPFLTIPEGSRVTHKAPILNIRGLVAGLTGIVCSKDRQKDFLDSTIKLVEDRLKPLQSCTLAAKLRAIEPKDIDIYGEDPGNKFQAVDQLIMGRARNHRGSPQDFDRAMAGILNDAQRAGYIRNWAGDYPKDGWREDHCFPGTDYCRLVEVWKMPWWGSRNADGTTEVKGILVIFKEVLK